MELFSIFYHAKGQCRYFFSIDNTFWLLTLIIRKIPDGNSSSTSGRPMLFLLYTSIRAPSITSICFFTQYCNYVLYIYTYFIYFFCFVLFCFANLCILNNCYYCLCYYTCLIFFAFPCNTNFVSEKIMAFFKGTN